MWRFILSMINGDKKQLIYKECTSRKKDLKAANMCHWYFVVFSDFCVCSSEFLL